MLKSKMHSSDHTCAGYVRRGDKILIADGNYQWTGMCEHSHKKVLNGSNTWPLPYLQVLLKWLQIRCEY